jgi:hypothetical protein
MIGIRLHRTQQNTITPPGLLKEFESTVSVPLRCKWGASGYKRMIGEGRWASIEGSQSVRRRFEG